MATATQTADFDQEIVDMPSWVRIPLECSIANRTVLLQKLRRARFLATIEYGRGAGTVDRAGLSRERQTLGLNTQAVRGERGRQAVAVIDFLKRAQDADVPGEAIVLHLRRRETADRRARPQFLTRGSGYYPSAVEAARGRQLQRKHASRSGDTFRNQMRTDAAVAAKAEAERQAEQDRINQRLGAAGRIRRARRGILPRSGKPLGRPITPTELRRGDRLWMRSSFGPIETEVTSLARKVRELAVGGFIVRGGKAHPVRDIDGLELDRVRARIKARRQRRVEA